MTAQLTLDRTDFVPPRARLRPRERVSVTGTIQEAGTVRVGVSPVYRCLLAYDEGELDVLFLGRGYRQAYALLLISSALALGSLSLARRRFPLPSSLEEPAERPGQADPPEHGTARSFTRSYWLFMCAGSCFAAGLLSYELISYHLTRTQMASEVGTPLLLAFATAAGVAANLLLGRAYDRFGLPVVLIAVTLSALCAPLMFLGSFSVVLAAMPLLGIGYAVQDTLLKAIVAGVLPTGRRNLAFGLFYAGYGGGWLLGSIAMGLLYQRSHGALVVFALAAQLGSLPLFWWAQRQVRAR